MSWFKKIMAMVLLVLWVPTTSHCLIESLDLLPEFLCCAEACASNGAEQGEDADACQSLESASYKVDETVPMVAAPVLAVLLSGVFDLAELDNARVPLLGTLNLAEPDIPVTWQFTFRTALPPRAPSFVS